MFAYIGTSSWCAAPVAPQTFDPRNTTHHMPFALRATRLPLRTMYPPTKPRLSPQHRR